MGCLVVVLQPSVQDKVIWRWTTDGSFTVQFAYRLLHEGSSSSPGASLILGTWAPLNWGLRFSFGSRGGDISGLPIVVIVVVVVVVIGWRRSLAPTSSLSAPSAGKFGPVCWLVAGCFYPGLVGVGQGARASVAAEGWRLLGHSGFVGLVEGA